MVSFEEKTLADLSAEVSTLGVGATLDVLSSGHENLLARGLLSSDREPLAAENYLFYPTSLLWAEMQTYAWALSDLSEQEKVAERQLHLHSSSGNWLEVWGEQYFGIRRYTGEADESYARRIVGELLRPNQNNVALEKILKDSMDIDATLLDAWDYRDDLEPELQSQAPGYFLLDMSVPGSLSPEEAQKHIDRAKDLIRRYKAAGTDFFEYALRNLEQIEDTLTAEEVVALAISASLADSFEPGPIRAGEGWRVGTPGLVVGENDAIKEQVLVRKIEVSSGAMTEEALFGG